MFCLKSAFLKLACKCFDDGEEEKEEEEEEEEEVGDEEDTKDGDSGAPWWRGGVGRAVLRTGMTTVSLPP